MRALPARPFARRPAGCVIVALMLAALSACARDPTPAATIDSPCDLGAGLCSVALGKNRTLTLELAPRPIPLMAPLTIRAHIDGATVPAATLDFVGDGMDMGLNRRTLTAGPDGALIGAGSLPVCVTGAMAWRADVTLKWPDGPQAVRFRFRTR